MASDENKELMLWSKRVQARWEKVPGGYRTPKPGYKVCARCEGSGKLDAGRSECGTCQATGAVRDHKGNND